MVETTYIKIKSKHQIRYTQALIEYFNHNIYIFIHIYS